MTAVRSTAGVLEPVPVAHSVQPEISCSAYLDRAPDGEIPTQRQPHATSDAKDVLPHTF